MVKTSPAVQADPKLMQSFYHRFLDSYQHYPSHVAVEMQLAHPRTEVDSYTFTDLRLWAEDIGGWLAANGVRPGDRCAILGSNSPRWVMAYLGILAVGAVAVPLDTAFKPEQVSKLLSDCGATLIFTDIANLDVARSAIATKFDKIRIVSLDSTDSASHSDLPAITHMRKTGANSSAFTPHQSLSDDLAVILYTSGTTSDPKGVMLTHANLDAEAKAIFGFIRIDASDAILGVLPLFHALAQMANILVPFSSGARVVYMEQLNTTELIRALRDRKITLFCCVPQFFYLIHEKIMKQVSAGGVLTRVAFSLLFKVASVGRSLGLNLGKVFFAKAHRTLGTHIRYLITGGSRFDPKIGSDLEVLGFDILQAYGLTEVSGGATVSAQGARFTGSVGKPLPSVEVKIADSGMSDATENNLSPRSGEVAIRGPLVMKGYYNRPEATAEVMRDGWFHTGDLGHLDDDGNLFITGRKKDVIVLSSGKNVYPEEVEAHYLASPWIKEICVMGLQSKPGEPLSERIHAVVVPNLDVMREKKVVNMREVIRYDIEGLSAHFPAGKRILSYDIWQTDLPRTTTRKLKRFEILKLVQQHTVSSTEAPIKALTEDEIIWMKDPVVIKAMAIVSAAAKDSKKVFPSDNLELDLGLDSMERVELVVALESGLGAQADPNMISEVYTVRELINAVKVGIGALRVPVKAGWDEVFKTESHDPEVLAILDPRTISTRLWFTFGIFVSFFCKVVFRLKTTGVEKLPKSGPFLLCPNHQSFLDGPVVASQLPFHIYKDLFYVGTSEIFGSGIMRSLARSLKLIPVDPDANLVPAMRAGAFGLTHGKILVLYPEGERSIDGDPKLFKKGAAILAVHHNVPIYPVALEGFHDAWPRGRAFRGFHRLQVSFGDPIFPIINADSPEAGYEATTDRLRKEVLRMWKPMHDHNLATRLKAED